MKRFFQTAQCAAVGVLAISISACGGGGGGYGGGGGNTTYSVGGSVSGLAGTGLTLLNGSATLPVSANGTFAFPSSLASGAAYAVTVGTQPSNPAQTCVVTSGSGTISGNVTNVAVACTTRTFTIGGTVTGLAGSGLVLRNNGGNDLAVSGNGAFAFTTPVASGAAYAVTVQTQPSTPAQTCTVTNGAANVGAANITNVAIACVNTTYTLGGAVTGLNGAGLVLQNNGGSDLSIAANGAFVFASALNNGVAYNVTVRTPPSAPVQQCSVTNGAGSIAGGSVTSVAVACGDVVPRFIYSLNNTQGTFSTFRVDAANGQLRSAGYSKLGTNPTTFRVASSPLDPNVGFFYALSQTPPSISASIIDRFVDPVNRVANVGPVAGSPFMLPSASTNFIVHPNNRFLYAPHSSGFISAFGINEASGALSPLAGSPFAAGSAPSTMLLSANGQFAYVLNRTSENIYVYSVNATTGVLTEIPSHRTTTGSFPNGMSIHPGGSLLYVANQGSMNVSGYAMNATTGALTQMAGSPFAAGSAPIFLTFHPNGRFAYVMNSDSHDLSGYAIDAVTGALTALGGSPFAAGPQPIGLVFDAGQRFMYVPTVAAGISAFAVDATTGVPTPVGAIAAGILPRLTTEPSGKYLYAGSGGLSSADNAIRSFSINQSTGALTPFTDTPVMTSGAGLSFLVSALPSSTPVTVIPKYVHIANDGGAGNGTIDTYAVNAATGALSNVDTHPTTLAPSSVAATPSGKYVYVANEDSNSIQGFLAIIGVLTTLGPPTATPAPHFIDIDAGGRFLFAANDSAISAYRIDAANGALIAVGAPIAANVDTLDIDHNGRCLFAADNAAGDVLAYTINSETGALTAATGSPFAAGDSPVAVKVHPSGRFVYTTNDGDNTVSAYAITTMTTNACALTPIAPTASAGPAGLGITSIAIEQSGRFAYVGNEATGAVSIMSINQTTGALTLVDTPVSAGVTVASVTADASGKFLYVAATPSVGGVQTLTTYNINASTGAITPAGTSLSIPNANAGTITAELLQ